jgi:nucleotide-binding universal stress UspA family protein
MRRDQNPMTYRFGTLLVHLNDKRRAEAVLEPVVSLASRYQAHVIGLHVYPSVSAPPIAVPEESKVRGSNAADERRETTEIAATFGRMTANQPFVAEWCALKVPHVDLPPVVLDYARSADIVIAGQTDPDWELSPLMDFPERLALESGRPTLIIPYVGRYPEVGRNVVIAWKAARESARAVFDALPILAGAQRVQILEIKERRSGRDSLAPDSTIAASLARHGIKATLSTSVVAEIGVGDEILSRVADANADLLVMGAYGHSRMREFIFGGATRHLMRHMTVPTLFAH